MKSFPKHFMVAIVLFVLAALIGGGLWFWTGGQLTDSLTQKDQLVRKLKRVTGDGIYPKKQNLDEIIASTQAIDELVSPVEASIKETSKLFDPVRGTADAAGNYPGLPANEWKRLLAEKREEVIALASQNNVALPEVFYMGFERYRALSPSESATFHLGVQLLAINELLNLSFQSGVTEFSDIKRVYTEDSQATVSQDGLSAVLAPGPNDWYTLYPFELKFTGVAKSVSDLTTTITKSPYYFIIRSIDVENEKTSVPRKSEVISQATGEGAMKNIIPIVGQENIKVTMRVDLVLWNLNLEKSSETAEEKTK